MSTEENQFSEQESFRSDPKIILLRQYVSRLLLKFLRNFEDCSEKEFDLIEAGFANRASAAIANSFNAYPFYDSPGSQPLRDLNNNIVPLSVLSSDQTTKDKYRVDQTFVKTFMDKTKPDDNTSLSISLSPEGYGYVQLTLEQQIFQQNKEVRNLTSISTTSLFSRVNRDNNKDILLLKRRARDYPSISSKEEINDFNDLRLHSEKSSIKSAYLESKQSLITRVAKSIRLDNAREDRAQPIEHFDRILGVLMQYTYPPNISQH